MKASRAYTLMEVMLVIGLTILVISFSWPAVKGTIQGSQLTQAGQIVESQIALARQSAITQNRDIEVRFYKCGDPSIPGVNLENAGSWKIRALQSFIIADTGAIEPLGKVAYLPQGVIMDSGATLSSIFDMGKRIYQTNPMRSLPRVKTSYSYFTMRFRPDGSTDFSPTYNGMRQLWFLSLHNAIDGDYLSAPPPNFWVIQIDPMTGNMMNFRP